MPAQTQGTLNPSQHPQIGFKLGLQATMDAMLANNGTQQATGEHGCFYLTSDTHRLYVGNQDGSISAVNEGVITVESYRDLPSLDGTGARAHAGEFYYITNEPANVLCVASGGQWVQINSSVSISGFSNTVTAANNVATITHTISETNRAVTSTAVRLEGASGNTVSVSDTNKITITGNTASVAVAQDPTSSTSAAEVTVSNSNDAASSSFNIVAGQNTSVAVSGSDITITATDNKVESVTGAPVGTNENGFKITVRNTNNSAPYGTIDPIVTYGESSDQSVHFVGGTATLAVYTKQEVDNKITAALTGFNAMTYRGTCTGQTLPTTSVHNGDVWILTESYTVSNHTYHAGTMAIATGVEDSTTGTIDPQNLSWQFVDASGTDTTYTAQNIDGGMKLVSSTNAIVGQLTVTGGNLITVTSNGTANANVQQLVVSHDTVSRQDSTTSNPIMTSADGTTTIPSVVLGVTTDQYGHITGVTTESLTIQTSHSTFWQTSTVGASSVAALVTTNNTSTGTVSSATVAQTFTLKAPGNSQSQSTATFGIASETLSVTNSGSQISLNLLWGSF